MTISLNETLIQNAKEFAKRNHTTLSQIIEDYLASLTAKADAEKQEITPVVKSLSGILNLPDDFDYKTERRNYLHKKYK